MDSVFISAGCTRKPKVSAAFGNGMAYGSRSNVVITDERKVLSVVCMDGDVNAVECSHGTIVAGDVNGRGYIIRNGDVRKHDFEGCIEAVGFMRESCAAFCTMDRTFVYDMDRNVITGEVENTWIPTCLTTICDRTFIGSRKGSVYVLWGKGSCVLWDEVEGHRDSIQDIKSVSIDGEAYIATASQDETIKIWRVIEGEGWIEHIQTLNGHTDWVYGLWWTREGDLLSSSGDGSIIHWKKKSGRWEDVMRLGGEGAFFNVLMIGDYIVGQSNSGGFYKFGDVLENFISGHIDEVRSIDWRDEFLLTASLDMTSRIFYKGHEVGRPQKHGYGLTSARFLNTENLQFISSAQETILRIYEPTQVFYMTCLSVENKEKDVSKSLEEMGISRQRRSIHDFFCDIDSLKFAAVCAELSLTNVVLEDFTFESLNEQLLSVATFNEIRKVYGHYFDVSDVAVSKDFIVSCNKSSLKKFSGIFVWNRNFELMDYIEVHDYGIERLVFSRDGKYLAAASKDKSVSIYNVSKSIKFFQRLRDHKRVVWDCSFSHDSKYLATCSRDRSIFVYEGPEFGMKWESRFEYEVTSLSFSPKKYLLLIGLESGEVLTADLQGGEFTIRTRSKEHSKRVNRISFDEDGSKYATGGADGMVKVFTMGPMEERT
ncbi:WD40 repeat-containing protein [Encephalitozoon intestinalis]